MSIVIDPQILNRCPADLDPTIVFLHAEGLSIVESIRVVTERYGLGLGEAKRLVTANPVWAEVVEATNRAIDAYLDVYPEG